MRLGHDIQPAAGRECRALGDNLVVTGASLLDPPIRLDAASNPFPLARPTDNPLDLAPHEFIGDEALEAFLRETYFGEGRELSSRTTPQRPLGLREGVWMLDRFNGIHGHEISQLRLLDPAHLVPSEDTGPERRGDVLRYSEWLRAGMAPPPITVVETYDDGLLRISNGHRRWHAAREAGVLVPAWVGPTVTDERGMRVPLTLENAHLVFGRP